MNRKRKTVIGVTILAALALTACGRSGFQYIENEEGGVFAKIPDDWEVISEGLTDFTLTGEDGQLSVLPGDDTLPWRAQFDAAPESDPAALDRVIGAIEVQPVDRRLRSGLTLESLLGFDPNAPGDDVTILQRSEVRRGDLSGIRITYEALFSGTETKVGRMVLADDRFTTVYEMRIFCDLDCFDSQTPVIEEIMDTFTIETS